MNSFNYGQCGRPLVLCDGFADRHGVEYLIEVYEAREGFVECFGVFELNEDGTKGDAVPDDEFLGEAVRIYRSWAERRVE